MQDFPLVFYCNYVSILHHFCYIIDYLPKLNRPRDRNRAHLKNYLSNRQLIPHVVKQCTKFEVSNLSRSRDILGELKIQIAILA